MYAIFRALREIQRAHDLVDTSTDFRVSVIIRQTQLCRIEETLADGQRAMQDVVLRQVSNQCSQNGKIFIKTAIIEQHFALSSRTKTVERIHQRRLARS